MCVREYNIICVCSGDVRVPVDCRHCANLLCAPDSLSGKPRRQRCSGKGRRACHSQQLWRCRKQQLYRCLEVRKLFYGSHIIGQQSCSTKDGQQLSIPKHQGACLDNTLDNALRAQHTRL